MSQAATLLRASVLTTGPSGSAASVLVDGSETPITANGLSGYAPTPGDRLLLALVGTQVEVIQFLSRGTVPYLAQSDLDGLQSQIDANATAAGHVANDLAQTQTSLQQYQVDTSDLLGTFQSSFDALSGVGSAGVIEDYFWVGDDPALSTVKSVQISTYVQSNLYVGDSDSFADAFNLWNVNDLGDIVFQGRATPMTVFYQAFEAAGLEALPFNR